MDCGGEALASESMKALRKVWGDCSRSVAKKLKA